MSFSPCESVTATLVDDSSHMRFPATPVGCLRFIRLCFRRRKPNPFPSFELYPYRALVWPSMGLLGLRQGSGEGGGTEVNRRETAVTFGGLRMGKRA